MPKIAAALAAALALCAMTASCTAATTSHGDFQTTAVQTTADTRASFTQTTGAAMTTATAATTAAPTLLGVWLAQANDSGVEQLTLNADGSAEVCVSGRTFSGQYTRQESALRFTCFGVCIDAAYTLDGDTLTLTGSGKALTLTRG